MIKPWLAGRRGNPSTIIKSEKSNEETNLVDIITSISAQALKALSISGLGSTASLKRALSNIAVPVKIHAGSKPSLPYHTLSQSRGVFRRTPQPKRTSHLPAPIIAFLRNPAIPYLLLHPSITSPAWPLDPQPSPPPPPPSANHPPTPAPAPRSPSHRHPHRPFPRRISWRNRRAGRLWRSCRGGWALCPVVRRVRWGI